MKHKNTQKLTLAAMTAAAYAALSLLGAVFGLTFGPIQVRFSALFGVLFLLGADILARWLLQPFELPNGVILALIGAPVLILVVRSGGFRSLLAVK